MSFKRTITESFLKESKNLGFSPSHFEILIYLHEKGPVTMKNIASLLSITPPSASSLVDKLVSKKLVIRQSLDNDRRTIHVKLGEESHKLFAKIHKRKMVWFGKMLNKLSKKEKEDLVRILNKCIS
jgi:MarR family 2-MHQ and catechol resistance regulon transcriptional repressor